MAATLKSRIVKKPPFAVDIIMPFHGAYEKVYAACKSIWYCTKENYHLYLVDDCSPNNTYLGAFAEAPHTSCVRTPQHSGFGAAVMEGYQAAYNNPKSEANPWVVILHSDCRIESTRWLMELVSSYELMAQQGVVMVSARSNQPGIAALFGEREKKGRNIALVEGYMPLYCTMFQRGLFEKIGGLKPYPYAMYEDEELSCRLAAYGMKQGVSGGAWVYHHGGATIEFLCKLQSVKDYEGPDYRNIMENNRNLAVRDIQTIKSVLVERKKQASSRGNIFAR